jgi:hypothetical protein
MEKIMDIIYYACDWVVNLKDVDYILNELFVASLEKGYDVLIITSGDQLTNDGFFYATFVVRISSEFILEEVVQALGRRLDLTNWRPITQEQYEEGRNLRNLPHPFWGIYIESLMEQGRYNQRHEQINE